MRSRNPTSIVKEYLEPTEPVQVRKNAVTALAALGDEESLALLVDSALNDGDAAVKERAEEEIAALSPAEGTKALQPILDGLKQKTRHPDAYALLGRLRSRGMSVHFPHLGMVTRLRLARLLRNKVYPKRGIRFFFRTTGSMSLGMLVAVLPISVYFMAILDITASSDFVGGTFGFYLVGWVLALPLVALATIYTSPLRYEVDIKGSAILDMLVAGLVCGSIAGLCVLAWASDHQEWGSSLGLPLMVLGGVTLGAAAVRGGTLAGFGILRGKWPNYLAQMILGGLCGVAVYDLAAIALGRTEEPFVSLGWIWTYLGGFALAGAYAKIDAEPRPRSVVSWPGRIPAFALAAVALSIGLFALIPGKHAPPINLGKIGKLPVEIPLRNVPVAIDFVNDIQVEAALDNSMYTVEAKKRPNNISEFLIQRNHAVTGSQLWEAVPELTKILSWPQLKARIKRTPPVDGPVMVTVSIYRPKPKPPAAK
jgi:hypothetical protein